MPGLLYKIKKLISGNSNYDIFLNEIQRIEKELQQIKSQLNNKQTVCIEKIIIDKIICDKVETNYTIDSITTENLSGTMNVGNVYPAIEPMLSCNKIKKHINQPQNLKPEIKIVYK